MPREPLFVCDIIPNTRFTPVVLVCNEGFVRRSVALHLADSYV